MIILYIFCIYCINFNAVKYLFFFIYKNTEKSPLPITGKGLYFWLYGYLWYLTDKVTFIQAGRGQTVSLYLSASAAKSIDESANYYPKQIVAKVKETVI